MLALRALTKRYGELLAVDAIDVECQPEEFLVVFGPAGAGKSSTLKMIAGVLAPTAGDVWFGGRSLRDVPPERRNMAMVFESYSLYSHLTVAQNLTFPLRARKVPEPEVRRRLAEMAEVLQITPLLERRPGFLSGGQRQRVALGRALIRDADVFLLDEPISHLDAKLRHRMRAELKATCTRKRATVVHVTHDFREAMALSDRMLVLDHGRVRQIGPPSVVYGRPADEFVAAFVGDPPMSFLDVRVADAGGRRLLQVAGGAGAIPAPLALAATLEKAGGGLRIGFRASEVRVVPGPAPGAIAARVLAVETLGPRNLVVAEVGDRHVRAFVAPDVRYPSGSGVGLELHAGNVHVFGDGLALHHPDAAAPTPWRDREAR
jgi:ABC-type sugar transport system ATPase subunit